MYQRNMRIKAMEFVFQEYAEALSLELSSHEHTTPDSVIPPPPKKKHFLKLSSAEVHKKFSTVLEKNNYWKNKREPPDFHSVWLRVAANHKNKN